MNARRVVLPAAAAMAAAAALALLRPSAPPPAGPPSPAATVAGGRTTYETGDAALDALRPWLVETLEANRKAFRGRVGDVEAFAAGTHYPQVWIRDSATLVPLARYHAGRRALESWIEEHLAHQREDGSLNDWVAAGEPARFAADAPNVAESRGPGGAPMSVDRNTTESDQESSAALAAAQVFAITADRAWLERPVAGVPLVERLDDALAYLDRERRDARTGLVTAAFTADWGDVAPVHPDQRAIYRDDATPVVAALYPSALFAGAARALAGLRRATGDAGRAAHWTARSGAMTAAIRTALWDPRRAFFRMHRLLSSPPGFRAPDDRDIFALGGNATAVLHGVADDAQAAAIVATAEERRARYGVPTIGAVLLPPYPAGFFRHPILSEEWAYQNGGQWDWWAGRFVLAEFERGHSAAARRHLSELARAAVAAGGLHEWRDREGRGKGSARYAGSAGALGAALYAGLFGVDLRADGLDLRIRLGDAAGSVEVWQPATASGASYRYEFDAAAGVIRLDYRGDAPGEGELALLLPAGRRPASLSVDGAPRALPPTRTVGRDTYAVLRTDWRPHRVELALR